MTICDIFLAKYIRKTCFCIGQIIKTFFGSQYWVHVQHCSTPNFAFVLAHVNVSQYSSLFTKDLGSSQTCMQNFQPHPGTMHDYAWDSHHKWERPGKEQLHQSNKNVWVALLQVRPCGHQARLDGKSPRYMEVSMGYSSNRTKWGTFQPTQRSVRHLALPRNPSYRASMVSPVKFNQFRL